MGRFCRNQRLSGPSAYRRIFDQPLRVGNHLLTVLARENGLDHARLGFAVSRRRIRRAVDRNTFKRIVRESFRANQARLSGMDIVVMARSAAAGSDRSSLRTAIDRQWPGLLQQRDRS